jgi:hypothetical protein
MTTGASFTAAQITASRGALAASLQELDDAETEITNANVDLINFIGMDLLTTDQNVAALQTLFKRRDLIHCIDAVNEIRIRLQASANRNANNTNQQLIDDSNDALTANHTDARLRAARGHLRIISRKLDFGEPQER